MKLTPRSLFAASCLAILPAVAAAAGDGRSGAFELSSTMLELAGAKAAAVVENVIEPDERITWEVFVPDSYDPERPAGLMVYISPTPSGDIPKRWEQVMAEQNLVWISANHSGNRVITTRRAVFALLAPVLAGRHFAIDPERVYVTGLSGGGKMAGMVAADYPSVFKGAIFNCGIDPLENHPPRDFELFRSRHFVFVTGTLDQALEPTIEVHEEYLEAGVENSLLMVIEHMTHQNPSSYDFSTAIDYLDSRIEASD